MFRVVVHQLELKLDHPLHHIQIGLRRHRQPSLDLKLMIDCRIRPRIRVHLQRAQNISSAVRKTRCHGLLHDQRKHRAPIEASQSIFQFSPSCNPDGKPVIERVAVWPRPQTCESQNRPRRSQNPHPRRRLHRLRAAAMQFEIPGVVLRRSILGQNPQTAVHLNRTAVRSRRADRKNPPLPPLRRSMPSTLTTRERHFHRSRMVLSRHCNDRLPESRKTAFSYPLPKNPLFQSQLLSSQNWRLL